MSYLELASFSRILDYIFLYLVGVLLSLAAPIFIDPIFYVAFAILIPFIWAPIEAYFITRYHRTPGNYVFGIRITEKMTYSKAFRRALWREQTTPHYTRPTERHFFIGIAVGVVALAIALVIPMLDNILFSRELPPAIKGWTRFDKSPEKFIIDFPNDPFSNVKQLALPFMPKPVDYNEYLSLQPEKNVSYSVSYIKLPAKVRLYGPNTVLKYSLNLIPENGAGAKVVSQKLIHYRRYPALDFQVRQNNEEAIGRLVLAGNTLFKIVVLYPEGSNEDLHSEEFLNSFYLKPRY